MKIVHLSTFDRAGGAAIAASRLHLGLRELGHESTLLVRDVSDGDRVPGAAVLEAGAPLTNPALHRLLHGLYVRRRAGADRMFSTDLPTADVASHPLVQAADVVNLHWTSGFVSVPAVRAIQDLGRRVVWTLHDQAVFTGGCHYSGSCTRYRDACHACPELDSHGAHVPSLVLRNKLEWLDASALDIVCPSAWLARRAGESALLGGARIHTVSNAVPVQEFQRAARADARSRLGLPAEATIVLLCADRLDEARKGGAHAARVLAGLAADPVLGAAIASGRIICTALGAGELPDTAVPILRLGRLAGDPQIALAYRAADLFLLPTLEDNLPNTMLEAVAAGVPVAAYRSGGVPELLEASGCGTCVDTGDVDALTRAAAALLQDDRARERCGSLGLAFARRELTPAVQAARYLAIYELAAGRPDRGGRTRSVRAFKTTLAAAEGQLLREAIAPPETSVQALDDLTRQIADQQDLIASRGGEILALRAELELVRERCSLLSAERAALHRRWRTSMAQVVIYGAGDAGRRVWEAIARRGTAHIVGFVDDDPRRQGRAFLGSRIEPPTWLEHHAWDLLVAADPGAAALESVAARWGGHRIVVCPVDFDGAGLARMAARLFPDPLAVILAGRSACADATVGIFGTGAGAMKVWEALADIDSAEALWFADNNPQRQGNQILWLPVIAPADIPSHAVDAIVVGSMSREAIWRQLRSLGTPEGRILTPDVTASVDRVREELHQALDARHPELAAR